MSSIYDVKTEAGQGTADSAKGSMQKRTSTVLF